MKTLVLEQRHLVGGAAITEELRPGFSFTTFSYALSLLRPQIIQELELPRHGFMPLLMSTRFAPMDDGDYLLFSRNHDENLREIARHSPHDADAYEQYSHDLDRVCQAIKPLLDMVPPDIFSDDPEELVALAALGSRLRSLDKRTLHNAVRLLTGSIADFLDDYFESEILKGYLGSSAIIGSNVGPRSQGSGLVLLFHSLGEHDGEFGTWAFHKGGNGGFTQVLARAARAFGAEIRTDAGVERVLTRDGRATGVALRDGNEINADVVVSALDARRTFLELVDPRELPDDLVEDVRRIKFRGVASKVNFALDGLPRYPALGDRADIYRGFTNIGPSIDYLERAFDTSKYGWYSEHPYIDCAIQSTIDPDMAPPGKHVLSCFVQYTPYRLRDSDWDAEREPMADVVQATLERYFPGFGELVLQREVQTPLDIERTVGMSEGNIFAGELLAPQMFFFRPAPGWSQYRTPLDGYYQCGSGTHPGGCVMGAPGRLAAGQILHDRAAALARSGS
jgi:phytoene dehydrogenase-like protein